MATLYVTEFETLAGAMNGGNGQMGVMPPLAEQTVSLSGTSAQSSAFNKNTRVVRLHTDAICSVEFGTNPTATAAKARMAANQTEYFALSVSGLKVAGI